MTDSAVLELPGMPAPAPLELVESDGKCLVRRGSSVLFAYDADDLGMRNLAIVALTEAGVEAKVAVGEAAAVFALTPTYVSMLRGRARKEGSAGLVKRMGRPAKLSARQVEQARRWSGEGFTQQEVASRLGVHQSQISLLLARRGPIAPQPELPQPASGEEELRVDGLCADTGTVPESEPELGVARVGCGVVECRYAGAMLGHAFFSRIGAGAVFAGLDTGARVRFDDAALLCATTLAFGLGVSSLEGAKHLNRREAGALAGLTALPHLRTLRPRLAAIADACDPLAVQRDLAGAMLSADAPSLDVYFVDDHFVSYGGAKPLGKGWNNKRKQAQKGHGDTLLTDWRGRAVVFLTGEPSGLTTTLPAALEQLRAVTGPDAKLMLGFDRGGAYASVFSACRDEKVDWITYRRGKLKSTLVKPTTYPYPLAEAEAEAEAGRGEVVLSDEIVEFKDYGPCRQLTLFEDGVMRLQVLTSDLGADAASLLAWLRARWRIENAIKDLARIYGIDWLCDYRAVEVPDDAQVDNPVRKAARRTVTDREADLQTAERALARLLESPTRPVELINRQIPAARRAVEKAKTGLAKAKSDLQTVPAKIPAGVLKLDQMRALPTVERRIFQMVLRLLAYNSELWLADRLNRHLRDDNEYRALTRALFHLGGTLHYTPTTITVELEHPDSPRLADALGRLLTEINQTPPHIPGDPRPISYTLAASQQ